MSASLNRVVHDAIQKYLDDNGYHTMTMIVVVIPYTAGEAWVWEKTVGNFVVSLESHS